MRNSGRGSCRSPKGKALAFAFWAIASSLWTSSICAENLSLTDCLARSKANSLALQKSEIDFRSAKLVAEEFATTRFPQLRIVGGANYAPASKHFGYDPIITSFGQISGQVIAEQTLFDAGKRRTRSTQNALDISRLSTVKQVALRDLELEVHLAFIENLRAQREVDLREQSLRDLTDYRDLVKRLNAGGEVAYTDLLRTEVELDGAAIVLSRSLASAADVKFQLATLMGDPMDTTFSLQDSLEVSLYGIANSMDLSELPDTNGNLELLLARIDYEKSQAEIKGVRNERLPTVSLTADGGLEDSRENLLLPASERFLGLGYSVGVTVELPLFDWGGQSLRVRQKELAAESTRLQSVFLNRSIQSEYQRTLAQFQSSRSILVTLRAAIAKTEENYLLTKAKYAAGAATSSEVLNALQLRTESRLTELETLSDNQLSLAKLTRLTAK